MATFYHHFDIVKKGDAVPPEITVRVCETLSCQMAEAGELLGDSQRRHGSAVRVVPAPCIGRCQHVPVAVVGQNPIDRATREKVQAAVEQKNPAAVPPPHVAVAEYVKQGGYRTLKECVGGARDAESVIVAIENSSLRGAGFPAGRKWRIVRGEATPRLMAANTDAIGPQAMASIHPLDLDMIGAHPGDVVTVASRRGTISLQARPDDGLPRGAVFIPFAYYEAAANILTNPALDPFGKIAEFKYCAVKVTNGGSISDVSGYNFGMAAALH